MASSTSVSVPWKLDLDSQAPKQESWQLVTTLVSVASPCLSRILGQNRIDLVWLELELLSWESEHWCFGCLILLPLITNIPTDSKVFCDLKKNHKHLEF